MNDDKRRCAQTDDGCLGTYGTVGTCQDVLDKNQECGELSRGCVFNLPW